jgi:hypothetical protein
MLYLLSRIHLFFLLDNIKDLKRREDQDLYLDLSFSPFMVAVLDVFFVGSSGLCLCRVALDLFYRSRSKYNLFNLRFDRLLWPKSVFRKDVYNAHVLLRYYLYGFCFIFYFLFVLAFGLRIDLLS